jgi:phage gp36-like protein
MAIIVIAPLAVIDKFGDTEIAQRSDSESATPITGAQLRTTIENGDRSSFTADEIAQADAAEARIQAACDTANGLISDAVYSGVGCDVVAYSIPASAIKYALDLARYELYDDNYPEYIRQGFEDAQAWLKDVATAKIKLDFGLCDVPQSKSFVMIDVEFPLMNTNQSGPIW